MAEFAALSEKLVRAAIARAAEIESRDQDKGEWTHNRRRALVAGLLRKRDFRAEVESDTTHADQAREREAAERERARRQDERRARAQQIDLEKAQAERERENALVLAMVAVIDQADDAAITAALDAVASDPVHRRAIDLLRTRGIPDRETAKSIRFRAAVIERLRTHPPQSGAA